MNVRLLLVGLCGTFFFVHAADSFNHLTKIFQHHGTISDNIVCYFSKEPICNKLPQKNTAVSKSNESVVFFLPMTIVDGVEAKAMFRKLNTAKHEGYSIVFQEVAKPIKGIKVLISYDPAKFICDYQTFDGITGDKGLVFAFHNKEMLAKIKISTDPLLQFAANFQDCKKKPKILLDFGHGGSDEGKVGKIGCSNITEKSINYQVGTKVASLLKKAGCEVCLSRHGDYFVALDERTTNANKKKVDIFLSIHANSGPASAMGIETYCLQSSLFKKKVASNNPELQKIFLMRDVLNKALAESVHGRVLAHAKKMHNVVDRKVKSSVTQVLLGVDPTIPSALIEIGFLSNQEETKLLVNSKYQMMIAQGITEGILNCLKKKI